MWRFMGVFLGLRGNFGGLIVGNIAALWEKIARNKRSVVKLMIPVRKQLTGHWERCQ